MKITWQKPTFDNDNTDPNRAIIFEYGYKNFLIYVNVDKDEAERRFLDDMSKRSAVELQVEGADKANACELTFTDSICIANMEKEMNLINAMLNGLT